MAILIVDDNPRMREMIRAILAPVDAELHECEDGAEAVEAFRRLRPRWVTMDIAMERLDGLTATRAIRDVDPAARVVIVTEHMEPALRRAAEEAGASAYVLKEDLSALLRVLDPEQSLHKALQASELRRRTLFDHVPVGLYRTTPDGRILDANAASVEMLGFPDRESLLEAPASSLYADPSDRERWRSLMEREGVVRDFEVRMRRYDGAVIWVRCSARVVHDDRGQVLCYEGAVVDVTEQKRVEAALRASDERYRSFISQTAEGVWRLELEVPLDTKLPAPEQIEHLFAHGYIAECNDAMARMYGHASAPEFEGARLSDLLVRSDAINAQHLLDLVRSGYRISDAETRELDRSGRERVFLNNITGIVWDGRLVRIWGTQRDVTERRRLNDALRASEERYRTLYDDTPSMYFTVDPAGKVLSVNRFGAAWLGYTPEELVGGSVLHVFHEADRDAAVDHVADCVCHPGEVFHWELRKICRDGTQIWVKEAARAVRGPEGTIVLIVCEDITERKRAEEQVRLSETMAAMGSLVLGVAHEVRNPLHALTGTVELIEIESDAPAEQRRSFEILREQVERLQRLMQDLLDFGRPAPVALRPAPLGAVMDAAVSACSGLAERRSVRVGVVPSSSVPLVAMDRDRMTQVFTNVLENAIAHAPAGSTIDVTVSGTGEGDWVECRFADQGPGFPAGDLARVFEPFYTRRPGGTGLGLSIVQRIVDQHHGHVEAANAAGGGAVVLIRLPAAAATASTERGQ